MPCLKYRIIWEDKTKNLKIITDFGTGNNTFDAVLHVRRIENSTPVVFDFDHYSQQYCLLHQSTPVGSMTITRHIHGPLDCSECYPHNLLEVYGPVLGSACKFRINPFPFSGFRTLRLMIREVWRDRLQDGTRLDLINAEQKLVPFYKRIGYSVIKGSDFFHPMLGTKSVSLMLATDPTRRSFLRDLFERLPDPLLLIDVLKNL